MKVVKFIAVAVVSLVLLLGGLVLVLNLVPFEQYKGGLERQIERVTGRAFAVGADSEISLSLRPSMVLRNLRLQNATWGSEPDMLKIGQAKLRIKLIPLLLGRVEVLDLLVRDLDLLTEVNDRQQSNWDFGGKHRETAKTRHADDDSARQLVIVMQQALVENARIIAKSSPEQPARELHLDKLLIQQTEDQGQKWDFSGRVNDMPVAVKGATSYFHELLSAGGLDNDLQGSLGDMSLTLKGNLALREGGRRVDQQATLKAPGLDTLSKLAGTKLPEVGPLELSVEISGGGDSHQIDLQGRLAELDLSLKGDVGKALDGRQINLEYAAKAPDFETVSKLAGIELAEAGPVSLSGRLSDENEAYLLQLTTMAAETRLDLEGQVARVLDGSGVDIDLRLAAPDLMQIGGLAGVSLPDAGPVSLQAQISDEAGGYRASGLVLMVDDSDLRGDIALDFKDEPMRLDARLRSERLDLALLKGKEEADSDGRIDVLEPEQKKTGQKPAPAGQSDEPERAADAQKAAEPTGKRVFSADLLPLQQLSRLNAEISYSAKQLADEGLVLSDFQAVLMLKDGNLELQPLEASIGEGSIKGDLSLEAAGKGPQAVLAFNLQGEKLQLGEFEQLKDLISGGPTRVSIQLSGAGESIREMMAGLNGEAVVEVGEAKMTTDTINLIGGDLVRSLLGALTPKKPEERASTLECAVIRFVVEDGNAQADKGIALQTEKSIIVGNGNIDLKTERIRLSIKSQNRAAVGVDAGDITRVVGVGGTLAEPKPIVDPEGVAKTAGTIGAAIATFGVSYLVQQLAGSVIEDKHPCQTALGKDPEQDQQQITEQDRQSKSENAVSNPAADAGQKAAAEPVRKEPVLPPDY